VRPAIPTAELVPSGMTPDVRFGSEAENVKPR
jgi:hypothetical protein